MAEAKEKTTSFTKLINGDTPVLVDFYADWCGPCDFVQKSKAGWVHGLIPLPEGSIKSRGKFAPVPHRVISLTLRPENSGTGSSKGDDSSSTSC